LETNNPYKLNKLVIPGHIQSPLHPFKGYVFVFLVLVENISVFYP